MARLSYELPLKLLVNSRWTGQMIAKNTFKKISYQVLNNGVDLSVFNCSQQCKREAKRECKQVLVLGQIQKYKGLDDLIAALHLLNRSYKEFELLIMSPDRVDIKDNLPFKVQIIHPEDDAAIAKAYCRADVFVSPSWYEGFANPPLEAMACGTPVVLTDSGGVREYAVHGYNCLMSAPRQPERLAENIKLVLQDKDVALRLAHNGIETAKAFTWKKSIDELEGVIMQEVGEE